MQSVAILWDIENVTPSTDSIFVNGLLDYADKLGRVSIATAYADWTRDFLKKLAEILAERSFELVHVPKSRKNSADMTLITQALEMIHQYDHIGKIILVTGDADFRPLLHALRRHNIEIHIICDAKSASEDLLILADEYRDYRELIADSEEEDDERPSPAISFEESLKLLQEAVHLLKQKRKNTSLGSVKVRMKLLNESFDESDFGCRSWKQYIVKASGRGAIRIEFKDNEMYIDLPPPQVPASQNQDLEGGQDIFSAFLKAVADAIPRNAKDKWASYSTVNQLLLERKIDYRKAKYGQFKKLVVAAEKRGLVESRSDGQQWFVRTLEDGA